MGAEDDPTILLGQPWQEERPSVALRGLTIDTGTYLYGDPSPAEQAHLERINRARLDPRAEAERLLGGDLNEGITYKVTATMADGRPSDAIPHPG